MYSFDKPARDKWAELNDTYHSQLDELNSLNDSDDFDDVEIDDFDELEIL